MEELNGLQRKYLRGLAHDRNPVVMIGQKGVTEALIDSLDEALDQHELIKVKFIDYKEKEQKQELIEMLEEETGCSSVGMIGHVAILYRRHRDPEKRKITLPRKKD